MSSKSRRAGMSKLRNAPKVLPITPAEPPRPKKDSFGLSASDAFGSGWIAHRRGFVAVCGSAGDLSNSAQGSVSSTRVRGDTSTGLGHHRRVGGVNWSKPSTASGSRVQTRKSARCPGGRSTLDVFTRHSPQGHRSSRLHIIAIHQLNRWFWIGTPSLHMPPPKVAHRHISKSTRIGSACSTKEIRMDLGRSGSCDAGCQEGRGHRCCGLQYQVSVFLEPFRLRCNSTVSCSF